jgi:hypothetical protein
MHDACDLHLVKGVEVNGLTVNIVSVHEFHLASFGIVFCVCVVPVNRSAKELYAHEPVSVHDMEGRVVCGTGRSSHNGEPIRAAYDDCPLIHSPSTRIAVG